MACFFPVTAFVSSQVNPSGKRSLVFTAKDALTDLKVTIPCGRCIGCKLERSRQWAVRCVHESQMWEENCFITLTYNDENLPPEGTLVMEHFQKFMKRLRKKHNDKLIRFFHCGEYGEERGRPHYHACLFNFDFQDKVLHKVSNGQRYYKSQELEKLWGMGHCIIGDVTFESAAYVARYITKKITGEKAKDHYDGLKPEYCTMSRRPGIGSDWFDQYMEDVYSGDFVMIRGKKVKPPKYYNRKYEEIKPLDYKEIQKKRNDTTEKLEPDNTPKRRLVKYEVQKIKMRRLRRPIEETL